MYRCSRSGTDGSVSCLLPVLTLCQQVTCPFVVLDGVLYGEHLHGGIARRHTIPEGLLCKTSRQRMTRQLRSRGTPLLRAPQKPCGATACRRACPISV